MQVQFAFEHRRSMYRSLMLCNLLFSVLLVRHAHGGPALTVQVIGQGEVSVDPPPPYSSGQTVTLTFSPSGGHQFITKPDVPPAAHDDPNLGWVFDHWTASPSVGSNALANPVSFTLNSDTTVYATFLNNGTAAHPSAEQESQLMSISQGSYIGWTTMTQRQANELFFKAELALDEYRTWSERYGQAATLWFGNFERDTASYVYDVCGEGMTWAGVHLQALALKHFALPEDQETLDDIARVLDAMDRNTRIAGDGYCIRFSGYTSDPAWQWYYQPSDKGFYTGASPFTNYTYIASTSCDVHSGYFLGLASVLGLCMDDPALWDQAAAIVERIVDRLILDNWRLCDGHWALQDCPEVCTNLDQLQKRCAYWADPVKYAAFQTEIENYTLDLGTIQSLYEGGYWEAWMDYGRGFGITLLETDLQKFSEYQAAWRTRYNEIWLHQNPYYTGVINYFDDGQLPAQAFAQIQGLLLAYPDGVKWHRQVDLFADPRFTAYDGSSVVEAALPNQRVHADFDPQRSAAKAQGGYLSYAYQNTNMELYLVYWLGRAAGTIPAPLWPPDPGTLSEAWVDFTWTDFGDGSVKHPFPTLDEAITALVDGGTIHLFPGNDPTPRVISKPLQMIGYGTGSTRLGSSLN